MKGLFMAAVVAAAVLGRPHDAPAQNEDWTRPFPPFRMIGNMYWVGSYDLSTYLITTPQGHILINTGVGDTAQTYRVIIANMATINPGVTVTGMPQYPGITQDYAAPLPLRR